MERRKTFSIIRRLQPQNHNNFHNLTGRVITIMICKFDCHPSYSMVILIPLLQSANDARQVLVTRHQ